MPPRDPIFSCEIWQIFLFSLNFKASLGEKGQIKSNIFPEMSEKHIDLRHLSGNSSNNIIPSLRQNFVNISVKNDNSLATIQNTFAILRKIRRNFGKHCEVLQI